MSKQLPNITDKNEMVIELEDAVEDSAGNQRFAAYWLVNNVGPHLNQVGTRGQMYHTNLKKFLAGTKANGRTVRFI